MDELNECPVCGAKTEVFFSENMTYINCTDKTCGYHNEMEK